MACTCEHLKQRIKKTETISEAVHRHNTLGGTVWEVFMCMSSESERYMSRLGLCDWQESVASIQSWHQQSLLLALYWLTFKPTYMHMEIYIIVSIEFVNN